METLKVIKERRSIRKFKDELVGQSIIEEIVDASKYSPTWGHSQIIRYNIIDNNETIHQISEEAMLGFGHNMSIVSGAPNILIMSHLIDKSGFFPGIQKRAEEWQMFDAGAATQTFSLAAHEKGVGSVVLGAFDQEKIAEIIGLPQNERVSAVIAFGYEIEHPKAPPRKELDEILRFV